MSCEHPRMRQWRWMADATPMVRTKCETCDYEDKGHVIAPDVPANGAGWTTEGFVVLVRTGDGWKEL